MAPMADHSSRLAERLAPGTRFVYEANTYHAEGGGSRFTGAVMTVKSGKWVKDLDVDGLPGGFRMEIPRAAKHVEWLDDNRVRYAITARPGHHVTLRLLPSPTGA